MSSPLTKTLTNLRSPPSSVMRSRRSSCWSKTASSASPTVDPSTSISPSPPVTPRSCAGIFTVTAMGSGTLASGPHGLQLRLEALKGRLDLTHLEAVPRRVERLQPLARDVSDHALVAIDVASVGELCERRDRHATRGLGED